MVRHIVCFDVGSESGDELDELLALLNQLPEHIGEIRALSCGRSMGGNADAGLVVDVDDWAALHRYRNHPEHQEALRRLRSTATTIHVADIEV